MTQERFTVDILIAEPRHDLGQFRGMPLGRSFQEGCKILSEHGRTFEYLVSQLLDFAAPAKEILKGLLAELSPWGSILPPQGALDPDDGLQERRTGKMGFLPGELEKFGGSVEVRRCRRTEFTPEPEELDPGPDALLV